MGGDLIQGGPPRFHGGTSLQARGITAFRLICHCRGQCGVLLSAVLVPVCVSVFHEIYWSLQLNDAIAAWLTAAPVLTGGGGSCRAVLHAASRDDEVARTGRLRAGALIGHCSHTAANERAQPPPPT